MKKYKIIFWSSLVILTGTATWLIVNRAKKKKLYKTLIDHLNTGAGSSGTISDLGSSGQPFNPGYYKTQGAGAKLLTVASAQNMAKALKSAIGSSYTPSDESKIMSIFKGLKAKTQVSFLAEQYKKLYNKDLLADLMTIDDTLLGLKIGTAYLPQIKTIVEQLPAK